MESNFVLIISFVLAATAFMVIWNNLELKKLIKLVQSGSAPSPDEHYLDLKYRIQFMSFAAALVVVFITLLGYGSLLDIKNQVLAQLVQEKSSYQSTVDSLVNTRIDTANVLVKEQFNAAITQMDSALSAMGSTTAVLRRFNSIAEDFGKLRIIKNVLLTRLQQPEKVVSFKTFGITNLKSAPIVFITPRSDFDISLVSVSPTAISVRVSNAKSDSVTFSMLLFTH